MLHRRAYIPLLLVLALACAPPVEFYEAKGVVRAVAAAQGQVQIAHDEIPGFMPAMTMSFDVAKPELLEGIEVGMAVRFELERRGTLLRITRLVPDADAAGATPGVAAGSAGVSGVAPFESPPEIAPDFALVAEDGRTLALSDLRGRAVLLDFIFTRCPGPCPLLTSSHVALQRSLSATLAARTHFVSVSLDPMHDTPERLREYAEARGADLERWSFLTGDPAAVQRVLDAYHVGTVRQADGSMDHVVATYLIGPDGRIGERYLGLDHDPAQIRADLERLLS